MALALGFCETQPIRVALSWAVCYYIILLSHNSKNPLERAFGSSNASGRFEIAAMLMVHMAMDLTVVSSEL